MNIFTKFIKKIFTNPAIFIHVSIAIFRGSFYIFRYCTLNRKVRIKFPFKAFAPVSIVGAGYVRIDSGCSVYKNVFKGLEIVTLSPEAQVMIDKDCVLGGLTIRCREQVKIGSNCLSALSLVQDTLWVNADQTVIRSQSVHDQTMPIEIGENVWIGGHCCILGGSKIGKDSVIAFNSVSYNRNQRDYTLAIGNIVTRDLPIDRIIKFKG